MSNKRQANNVYSLLDNELERMHDLLNRSMQAYNYADSESYRRRQLGYHPDDRINPRFIEGIHKRIFDIQEVLMKSVATCDQEIQEKVAELALTGKSEE